MTARGDITAGVLTGMDAVFDAVSDAEATVAATAAAVASALKARGATAATAESCTGGRVAAALTEAAGASEYFTGGVVAYSNEVKVAALGVSRQTLERHGAVSGEVAREMALGALRLTGARYAVATTGIAGPGGGSPAKPVGTVWIAVAGSAVAGEGITGGCGDGADGTDGTGDDATGDRSDSPVAEARCFHFAGGRTRIMAAAVRAALAMLGETIERS